MNTNPSTHQPHPDDLAVDAFAEAMKRKMAKARAEGASGWEECSTEWLQDQLLQHIHKGDPRDVANYCMMLWARGNRTQFEDQLAAMETRKDGAYLERNQVVAALAKCFPSGVARTAIEGWSEDWHGCVYIDLPTGQASWHFHDSQAYLFEGLPQYDGKWDGHTTEVKYQRLEALMDGRHHVREKLNLVELAIHEYHAALDQREHGGVAQSRAISHIENCLGIHWQVGGDEPRFEPDADLVHQVAKGLIFIAEEAGQVVTVERTPRQPLAMGNADYLVSVRPKREAS